MNLVPYEPALARAVTDLYHRAVHAIDPKLYTPEQQEAWAPTPPDYEFWSTRLKARQPLLALDDDRLAGFIELEADGHIDCFYVDPDYQHQGVGARLYERIEKKARRDGIGRLFVEASLLARPFFEKRGFAVVCRNEVCRQGQVLINFTMEKRLKNESTEQRRVE
ncbi:GNAT family N-acetyltransferase [Marinobacterium aestuariivivens]|uniref:GNAT family N-acetyltransferase n=1 Tax=Marinobacterium aestuariivivens TaxID=1698799 RepID=A0ABW2A6S9_9GAMM